MDRKTKPSVARAFRVVVLLTVLGVYVVIQHQLYQRSASVFLGNPRDQVQETAVQSGDFVKQVPTDTSTSSGDSPGTHPRASGVVRGISEVAKRGTEVAKRDAPGQDASSRLAQLDQCQVIRQLTKANKHVGKPLRASGRDSGEMPAFWLKQPLLHTIWPGTNEQVMILKYNHYNPTQHLEKWSNTIHMLSEFYGETIFPKLYGYCDNVDGFHVVAVEYIAREGVGGSQHMAFDDCVSQVVDILDTFRRLDDLGLYLSDMKLGQWMFRDNGQPVLQDIDDVLRSGEKLSYDDQARGALRRLKSKLSLPLLDVQTAWDTEMFPRNQGSIRYCVLSSHLMLGSGVKWSMCTGVPSGFRKCLQRVESWTVTMGDDWPDFSQIIDAVRSCQKSGTFERTQRTAKSWHQLAQVDRDAYTPPSACSRPYDKPPKSLRQVSSFSRCEYSCCRSKGSSKCHYATDMSNCQN